MDQILQFRAELVKIFKKNPKCYSRNNMQLYAIHRKVKNKRMKKYFVQILSKR